jgi:hypothetical protein
MLALSVKRPPLAASAPPGSVRAWLSALVLLAGMLQPLPAWADSMDVALERLVTDSSCHTPSGAAIDEGSGQLTRCFPDDEAFKKLVNQYGMAIAPTAMYPARTTGYGGFEIALEGAYSSFNSGADYLRLGTRGSVDPATGDAARENTSVPSLMQLYSLRIRKGFGFGLETGLSFGYLTQTSIISGGLDVRLALLEGFRKGPLGALPDVAIAGGVRTITGSSAMQLTTTAASGVISKPISIAQSGVLTPWAGYQFLWLFGDSGIIDLTPATDALAACGFSGPNQPGFSSGPGQDGTPICSAGDSEDFNNNVVFEPARLERQRLFLGVNYRYEMLTVGGQVMLELVDPAQSQDNAADSAILDGEPKSVAFALQVGAFF